MDVIAQKYKPYFHVFKDVSIFATFQHLKSKLLPIYECSIKPHFLSGYDSLGSLNKWYEFYAKK